jgi:hypothetical protein
MELVVFQFICLVQYVVFYIVSNASVRAVLHRNEALVRLNSSDSRGPQVGTRMAKVRGGELAGVQVVPHAFWLLNVVCLFKLAACFNDSISIHSYLL